MIYFTFLAALALSSCAGFYSVIGLAAIFPGSFWPVIIMGTVLEFSKLVTTSWVYRNWTIAPRLMRYYMVTAIIILMMITSMGIFGYLSKAHLEHSSDMSPLVDKVALLDDKIKTEKENIDGNRKILKQLDEGVDQIMARSDNQQGAERSLAIRKAQQKDRSRISQEIQESQKSINAINEERAPLNVALQKAESDFGPIKYVAELIYGSGDKDLIDKAVRLVIMLIMIVFDPLAVLLLISANMSLSGQNRDGVRINEENEIVGFTETVPVKKNNIVTIKTPEEPTENVTNKKLEPKYDYTEPFSFKEKE